MSNGKDMIIHLIAGLIKNTYKYSINEKKHSINEKKLC